MNEKEILAELEKGEKKSEAGNSYILGTILGLIVPIIALVFFNNSVTKNETFTALMNNLVSKGILASVLSMMVLPNLLLFFLFLKMEKMKSVKGVIAATIIFGIIVYIAKFIIQAQVEV